MPDARLALCQECHHVFGWTDTSDFWKYMGPDSRDRSAAVRAVDARCPNCGSPSLIRIGDISR